jgi:hypothetical protein
MPSRNLPLCWFLLHSIRIFHFSILLLYFATVEKQDVRRAIQLMFWCFFKGKLMFWCPPRSWLDEKECVDSVPFGVSEMRCMYGQPLLRLWMQQQLLHSNLKNWWA